MRVDAKTAGGALWKQVAAALRGELRRLHPGHQLPTENGLAARFGVSRFTIRKALADMEKDGLVRIEHGRGLFVAEDPIAFTIGERTRFSENIRRLQLSGDREILSIAPEPASEFVARQLGLAVGDPVLRVEALISAEGRPLGLGRNLYPLGRFPDLAARLRATGSSSEALASLGVPDYRRKGTWILGRLPSAAEARLLRIARTRPVLEVQKLDVDAQDRPVGFGIGCHAADRLQFFIE